MNSFRTIVSFALVCGIAFACPAHDTTPSPTTAGPTCGGSVTTPPPTLAPTCAPPATSTAAPTCGPPETTAAPTCEPPITTPPPTLAPTCPPPVSSTAAPTCGPPETTAAPTCEPPPITTPPPTLAPTCAPPATSTAAPTCGPPETTAAPTCEPPPITTPPPTLAPTCPPTASSTAPPTSAPTCEPTTQSPTPPPSTCPPPRENIFLPYQLPGTCPLIQYITNVDLTLANGYWYRVWSTRDATAAGCDGDCITMNVFAQDYSNAVLTECCRQGTGSFCSPAVGSGIITLDPVTPGVILYSDGTNTIPLFGIGADPTYSKYIILYSCSSTPCGGRKEFLDVYVRDPKDGELYAEEYIAIMVANGVDVSKVEAVRQHGTCPYV